MSKKFDKKIAILNVLKEQNSPASSSKIARVLCSSGHDIGERSVRLYLNELDDARVLVAEYINSKVEEIAFLINTSSGMSVIARLIENGGIIYPEGEFPSSIHIFKSLGFNTNKINS